MRISTLARTVCLLPHTVRTSGIASLVVVPALLLSLVLALALALLGILRGALSLRSLVLALLRLVISALRVVLGLRGYGLLPISASLGLRFSALRRRRRLLTYRRSGLLLYRRSGLRG